MNKNIRLIERLIEQKKGNKGTILLITDNEKLTCIINSLPRVNLGYHTNRHQC